MHIALPANRCRVAQSVSHMGNDLSNMLLQRRAFEAAQGGGCQNRAGPSAEILGRYIPATDVAQIVVYVARRYFLKLAALVLVLKKILPAQFLTRTDNLCHTTATY